MISCTIACSPAVSADLLADPHLNADVVRCYTNLHIAQLTALSIARQQRQAMVR
jgi:hypothetical protein